MSRVVAILVGILMPLGARCEDRAAVEYRAEGFAFPLPRGVRVIKRTPVADSRLYEFKYKGKSVLHAYAGNHPDVRAEFRKEGRDVKAQKKGCSIRSLTKKAIGGVVSREVLFVFSFRAKWGWPSGPLAVPQ